MQKTLDQDKSCGDQPFCELEDLILKLMGDVNECFSLQGPINEHACGKQGYLVSCAKQITAAGETHFLPARLSHVLCVHINVEFYPCS